MTIARATFKAPTSHHCIQVEFPEQHAVLKRPHQMLELLLASSGNERAGMSGRHHRVLNVMLQAALVNLSQSHSQQAPAHATRPIVTALGLLQVCTAFLYRESDVPVCISTLHAYVLHESLGSCGHKVPCVGGL